MDNRYLTQDRMLSVHDYQSVLTDHLVRKLGLLDIKDDDKLTIRIASCLMLTTTLGFISTNLT